MPNTSGNPILLNLKHFLASGQHPDLTISCDGKDFKVHKIILNASSPVLSKLVGDQFKESSEDHAAIELHDDVEALAALIHYIYNFVYNDSFARACGKMSFAVKVFAIADKYDLHQLQNLAAQKFKQFCNPRIDLEDFLSAVSLIEENTPLNDNTLRNYVITMTKRDMVFLLNDDRAKNFILGMPDLTLELLSMLDESVEQPVGTFIGPSNRPYEVTDEEFEQHLDDHDSAFDYAGGGRRLGQW